MVCTVCGAIGAGARRAREIDPNQYPALGGRR